MPRQKSLLTIIRDMVQQEVRSAIQSLLGSVSTGKTKPKNGRRRRGRRRGPGRPPGSKNKKARGLMAQAPRSRTSETGRYLAIRALESAMSRRA